MKVKFDQAAGDRALEAIVTIADYFTGSEEESKCISDADRLQCALRRLSEFAEYVDTVAHVHQNNYETYYERLLSAIERVAAAMEVDLHDGE